jgi:hypothetical protein
MASRRIWGPHPPLRMLLLWTLLAMAQSQSLAAGGNATTPQASMENTVLPPPTYPPFLGRLGLRTNESKTDWPKTQSAPRGSPNILLILIDDAGAYAQSLVVASLSHLVD